MKAFMKMILVVILLGAVSVDPVLAQPPPRTTSQDASVTEAIKQLEQDWADAMIAVDIPRLSQIMADDWIHTSPRKTSTKASYLENLKSGKYKLETCEFGPRNVMVLGDVAVLQGSVTETVMSSGQRSTVRVVYMDVWVKRGDRWVVVRSHTAKA